MNCRVYFSTGGLGSVGLSLPLSPCLMQNPITNTCGTGAAAARLLITRPQCFLSSFSLSCFHVCSVGNKKKKKCRNQRRYAEVNPLCAKQQTDKVRDLVETKPELKGEYRTCKTFSFAKKMKESSFKCPVHFLYFAPCVYYCTLHLTSQ